MAKIVTDYARELYNTIVQRTQESTIFANLLQQAEDKTGIPASYIVTGLTTVLLMIIVLGYGPIIMFDIVVVFYPAYQSFQALEASDEASDDASDDASNEARDKMKHWMKYWIVFGLFRGAENIGDCFLWWLPGYFLIKIVFLVWCFAPVKNNGSIIIYENYVRETFLHHTETVDNVLQSVRSLTSHTSNE